MSLLRLSRPGEPLRLIDQGPASAYRSFTRSALDGGYGFGGAFVLGTSDAQRNRERARKHVQARKNARNSGPVCAKWMPLAREYCARPEGHKTHCRTDAVMEYDRLRHRGMR